MRSIIMSKKKYDKLESIDYEKNVLNSGANIYFLQSGDNKLAIKQFYKDFGEDYTNRLYTIKALLNNASNINIDELVMPKALVLVNKDVIGYAMDYIPSVPYQAIMDSKYFSIEEKINYLKQMGNILEKIKKVRETTNLKDFYLNDVHESNFVLNLEDTNINVVDMDSIKFMNNIATPARYLTPFNEINKISKYKKDNNLLGGIFKINEDTDLYSYIVIILNTIYGDKITKLSKEEYYNYIDYLSKLGVSKELVDKFSYVYSEHKNENPYELLDELASNATKMHKEEYKLVRNK